MSSFQLESTRDVWVSDKIAHVGGELCLDTHNKTEDFFSVSHHIGLENIYTNIKAQMSFFFTS